MSEEKHSYYIGLDVGTSAVRCVVGELTPEAGTPSIIGFASAENTGLRKGNIAHAEEVTQAIINAVQEAERMSGRKINAATVNVNGAHVQGINSKGVIAISGADRQITHEDRMRVEEAATVIQLPPNKDIIQVFAKNYRLDGQDNIKDPLGMHGVRLEVDTHILLAGTPALKSLDQVLHSAEIHPNHHTVTGLAVAEAVLDRKMKESGVAVLDIGAATTNLIVIEDGEVEHIAVIPMGGTHVTNDLAIGLKTDLDIAEEIKLKYASLGAVAKGDLSMVKNGETLRFDREMLKLIVEARMEELLEFVDKELKRIHRSRRLPGGVVLAGGGAKLPGIAEFTRDVLELPARVGKWGHINKVVDGIDEEVYAPAVGLMLLDMLLGPAQGGAHFSDSQPGMISSMSESFSGLLRRVKRGK